MTHEEPDQHIFKSGATSQSGRTTPDAVAEERESEYSNNSMLDSSNADWINDDQYVNKQIIKQQRMGANTSRRISDYFGALQIDELDESYVDVKLEGKIAI